MTGKDALNLNNIGENVSRKGYDFSNNGITKEQKKSIVMEELKENRYKEILPIVYENAVMRFPVFSKASLEIQTKVLNEALNVDAKDMYALAKNIYFTFQYYGMDKIIKKDRRNYRVVRYKYKKSEYNAEPNFIGIECEYTKGDGKKAQTLIPPCDVWKLFVRRISDSE